MSSFRINDKLFFFYKGKSDFFSNDIELFTLIPINCEIVIKDQLNQICQKSSEGKTNSVFNCNHWKINQD